MTWKMTDEQAKQLASLMALSGLRKAMIEQNPAKFIAAVAAENGRLVHAIQDALVTLSGAADFDMISEILHPGQPMGSFSDAAYLRNQKAAGILNKALSAPSID